MNKTSHRQTAQILAFPLARRLAAKNLSKRTKFAAEIAALRAEKAVATDGWYHQAAIEESESRHN
ncbi:MAG TPA: DUF2735 domain-containing protein [Rhizobiaceae bacterium]|nr:DUF2735 domain-containing protein [Rhizobiaceae bacterium]